MPRFFFHLGDAAGQLKDKEGMDLPDAEAAWFQAVRSVRDLMSADLSIGLCREERRVSVEDESGATVQLIPFAEVAAYLA